MLVQHEARAQIDADKMTLVTIVEAVTATRAEISFDEPPADPISTVVAQWNA